MKKHQKTIEQEVINFINRHQLLSDAKKVLIGLSGGADSVFALNFFNKYKKKYKIEIAAVHINHNLRGKEADYDENFCRNFCSKLNIEFFSESINVKSFAKKKKLSIEEAARILRYKKFDENLKKSNSDLIITAHNSDDNLESVLLNIVSGTGIEGLSGITIKKENLIRPFLCISKSEIFEYLKNGKIDFVTDSSNSDINFRRNFIRNEIIPNLKKVNPSLNETVLNSSEVFRNQNKILNYFIENSFWKIISKNKSEINLDLIELKKYPKEILGEILKLVFEKNLKIEFNFKDFLQFENLISSKSGTKLEFSKEFFAIRERNKIVILKKNKISKDSFLLELNSKVRVLGKTLTIEKLEEIPDELKIQKNVEIISAEKIEGNLVLRKWKAGDKIQLLGMKGTKKVSDVLTDLKIPNSEKENQWVLLNNDEVIYLVGLRISEKYKITNETKNAIKICLK
ncbi:MAG: tRNA lysidine(34) synthetase TilS [Ignavibacteriae bacterium]|nr:tRNA lysidine(34) synthetase TilS [Ignavibacteriota bacterium]